MRFRGNLVSSFVMSCVLLLITAEASRSGEFRPLDMPDQKNQYRTERSMNQAPTEDTYAGTYRRFEEDVRRKDPAEWEDLKKFFSSKRSEAIKREQWQEVKYYSGLLDILDRVSKERRKP